MARMAGGGGSPFLPRNWSIYYDTGFADRQLEISFVNCVPDAGIPADQLLLELIRVTAAFLRSGVL